MSRDVQRLAQTSGQPRQQHGQPRQQHGQPRRLQLQPVWQTGGSLYGSSSSAPPAPPTPSAADHAAPQDSVPSPAELDELPASPTEDDGLRQRMAAQAEPDGVQNVAARPAVHADLDALIQIPRQPPKEEEEEQQQHLMLLLLLA